jgi:integrase
VKRPSPVTLPPLKAYARRHHEAHGWYWQVVYQGRAADTAWSGYATVPEVTRRMAELVASGVTDRTRDEVPTDAGLVSTVADLLEVWLGSSVDPRVETGALSRASSDAYTAAARHLKRLLGTTKLHALDRVALDRYDLTRVREGYSPSTVHHERITLGAAWRWGVEQGLCPSRALPRATVRPQEREAHIPTRQEVAQVFRRVHGWHLVALRLQAATGARASEIGHLQIRDVDLDNGLVRIRESKTDPREVPVAPVVLDLVRDWVARERADLPPSAPLLVDAPATHTAPALNGALSRAQDAEGLPRWSTHALRYRAVIDMIDAGVDPKTACEITGHSLTTMLSIYRRVSTSGKRHAVALARLGYLPEVGGAVVDFQGRRKR